MTHYKKVYILSLCFLIISPVILMAQKLNIPLPDSLITVGYATGKLRNVSGSVEKITEIQMNREQITTPLDAIRGRVPGLTIQRSTNSPAALDAVQLAAF